jgi:tRNA threonylcarbamoyladenosine biosynthesis protein TsaB
MTTVLALETSSELASVALLRGENLTSRQAAGVQSHSQTVLPMALALLQEAGIELSDCDVIAFGCGPGSFTGVRTACALAQGMAFGVGLPLAPVITLEAMADACRLATGATDVLAVLDARMNEVYWAQYRYRYGQWEEVSAPTLSAAGLVSVEGSAALVGNGVPLCTRFENVAVPVPGLELPHAVSVARLGKLAFEAGRAVDAQHAQPLYLRNKIALTTAERAAKANA